MDVRDPEDSRYVRSFAVDGTSEEAELALAFYRDMGFVVFRDVYSSEECQLACDSMWSYAESDNPGLSRSDPSTWDKYRASGKYGLSLRGPSFDPVIVNNRQNEKLAVGLALVLEIPVEDVMVGHDRFTIYRATELEDTEYLGDDKGGGDDEHKKSQAFGEGNIGKRYLTGKKNVHLDLNPWWWLEASPDILVGANSLQYDDPQDFIKENNLVVSSMGPHVQCVLNFSDNLVDDGGTIVVPRFHTNLPGWCEKHRGIRKPVPFVTFNDKNAVERACEEELFEDAIRVSMRAGSVLIWNQTLAHGTQPNTSRSNRMAQFLKAFSRKHVFSADSREMVAAPVASWVPPDAESAQKTVFREERSSVEAEEGSSPCREERNPSSKLEQKKKKQQRGKAMQSNVRQATTPLEWDGPARLQRRSASLTQQLRQSAALGVVTSLGRSLFGLDQEAERDIKESE